MLRRVTLLALTLLGALAPAAAADVIVSSPTVSEGGTATFTVTRTMGDLNPYSAQTADQTATAPADYTARSSQGLSFDINGEATVQVPTVQDAAPELDETFKLVVTTTLGGATAAEGVAKISDNDPASATPADASATEGQPARVTIALTPIDRPATIAFETIDGSAAAGSDYTAQRGAVDVPAKATQAFVDVPIADDDADEDSEAFQLKTTGPDGVARTATVTIAASDPRFISVGDVSVLESDDQSVIARVPIGLDRPTTRTVTARWGTIDGAAVAPRDYLARLDTLTIPPGQTQAVVDVPIVGDDLREEAEAFGVVLGEVKGAAVFRQGGIVAITDDDGLGTPVASSDDTPPNMTLERARLASARSIRVMVACPKTEQRCRGRLTLYAKANRRGRATYLRKERRIGVKAFSLPGDASETLRFVLPSRIASGLRRNRKLTVQAFLVAQDAAANVVTKTKTTTLRSRAPRR